MRFKQFYTYLSEEKLDNWEQLQIKYPELKDSIELLQKIKDNGFEVMIVGGAVRDLILGRDINDVDITTNATPNQVEKIFGKTIDIGKNKEMGITVVPHKGENVEIATYRKDVYDALGNAKGADRVELTTSFKDDTSRRDFTINSIGIDIDGNIVDHHNGIRDIKNKIITAVGDPSLRFKEDMVRILRAVRFASRLGFNIDKKTIDAIKSNAPEIQKVAKERIMKEIKKMAEQTGTKFADAILMMKDVGILQYIFPEIVSMESLKHSKEHHPEGGVLDHTIAALRTYTGNDPIVNMAIMSHDIGKTETYMYDDIKGTHTYKGHEGRSSNLLNKLADRLKLDNKTREALIFAASNHMNYFNIPVMSNNKVAQLIKSPYFDVLEKVAYADVKARGSIFDQEEWDQIQNKINRVREMSQGKDIIDSVKKIVNGALIMRLRSEIKPGPLMGKIISDTVETIIDNEIDLEDIETIENLVKDWQE